MAVFTLTHAMRQDNYAVLQTLEATEIGIGQSITVAGSSGFNGTFTVLAVPVYRFAGVDDEGELLAFATARHPDEGLDQGRRQIVDDEEAEVFEGPRGRRLAGAGEAREDDDLLARHPWLLDAALPRA